MNRSRFSLYFVLALSGLVSTGAECQIKADEHLLLLSHR